jgi:YVTN family beta-propeller protein
VLPRGGAVVARIPLGRGAPAPLGGGALTVGEGAVWAMSNAESTLMRIDPARNAVVARIKVNPPDTAAAGNGAVWLTYPSDDTVSRIDPATNRVVATIRVGPKRACCAEHMSLTASGGALWVAVPNGNEIVRIDPTTNDVVETLKLPYSPCAFLVADQSAVWSAGGACADHVGRIDIRTKTLTASVAEPHAVGLALAFGSLWAAVIDSANLDRIDPHSGRLVARLHVGGTPVRVGVGFGSIWVDDDNGRVLRIRPAR